MHNVKKFPGNPKVGISPVAEIIDEIRAGRMVILVDEEERENEGDLVIAAEFATAQSSTSWRGTAAGSSA